MTKNKLLVLVIGNIGTGKTNFLQSLNNRERRVKILNDEYPSGDNSKISLDISDALYEDKVVILEGNYMSKRIRSQIINPLNSFFQNLSFICFDFGSGNKTSLKYRLKNPSTDKTNVKEVHYIYKEQYEEPSLSEGFLKIFKCRNNYNKYGH